MKFSGIYAIVDAARTPQPLALVDAIVRAGIGIVQYRAKAGVVRDLLRAMLERTRAAGIPLIVNDDFEAALEADGWHAGQEDLATLDVAGIRARLGRRIFGISCSDPAEARAAAAAGADYLGVGPFVATATKGDAGEPIGVSGINRVVAATSLPVVAIGGIDLENLAAVARSGAAMAAVISALAGAADPLAAARALVARWEELRA